MSSFNGALLKIKGSVVNKYFGKNKHNYGLAWESQTDSYRIKMFWFKFLVLGLPLMLFKLMSQRERRKSESSKFVCEPRKRNTWTPEAFHVPQPQSPLVFAARSYGDFSSWHWNPGMGGLVCGWALLLSERTSAAEIHLPIFIHHLWVWDQPIRHLCPSYQSPCGFFFKSLVAGLPFSHISGGSEWWLLGSLVVILMWLQEWDTLSL